jgi:hypothetical protein
MNQPGKTNSNRGANYSIPIALIDYLYRVKHMTISLFIEVLFNKEYYLAGKLALGFGQWQEINHENLGIQRH